MKKLLSMDVSRRKARHDANIKRFGVRYAEKKILFELELVYLNILASYQHSFSIFWYVS